MPWDCDTYWEPDRRVWPPSGRVQLLAAAAVFVIVAAIATAFIAVSV